MGGASTPKAPTPSPSPVATGEGSEAPLRPSRGSRVGLPAGRWGDRLPAATGPLAAPGAIDGSFLVAAVLLVVPGLLMLLSASNVTSYAATRDSTYYLYKQLRMLGLGVALAAATAAIDYHRLAGLWQLGFLGCFAVLAAVLTGLGQAANGAQRWIAPFGYALFQPGELVKPVLVVATAAYMTHAPGTARRLREGLGAFALAYGAILLLIMLQPDMGTAGVVVAIGAITYVVAGAPASHLAVVAGGGALAAAGLVAVAPYRLARWTTFLDPWANAQGTGYHVVQSLLALGAGGLAGVGAGVSRQKFFFLPFPHTDSIFAVLGEEFGLVGTVTVVGLFTFLMWRGLDVAARAPDPLGRCIAAGATMGIVVQALVNVAVLTSSVPFTGITLPFFSYGGSSMVATCVMCGLVLSVSRHAPREPGKRSWLPGWRRRRDVATA